MAQDGTTAGGSSYTIDNVTFPVGRSKLQSIFDAIRSTNIGNTAPDLVAGQFWIDNNTPSTTVWTLYLYDGTDNISFATIDTVNNTVNFLDSTFDLINDTTPQLGGNLASNGNDIIFADNDKAIFGASSDLQIFHSSTSGNSFIKDVGTGALILGSDGTKILLQKTDGENMGVFNTDGSVDLYHNNVKKFETTSTGATVTGNLTASGNLTSLGIDDNATSTAITIDSNENVGIGTTSPNNYSGYGNLTLGGTSGGIFDLEVNGTRTGTLLGLVGETRLASITNIPLTFQVNNAEKMRLTSTGLGIFNSNPGAGLEVTNSNGIKISRSGYSQYMQLYPANNNIPTILGLGGNGIHIGTTTSTGIHVDGSDNVGIGTTAPPFLLSLSGNSQGISFTDTSGGTNAKAWLMQGLDSDFRLRTQLDNYGGGQVATIITRTAEVVNTHQFFTEDSERMRLTTTGLGIGTSSPSPDYGSDNILEIAGGSNPGLVINDTGQASKYGIHAVSADFVMLYGTTAFFRYKPGDSQITAHDNLKIITGTSSGVTPSTNGNKLFIDGIGNQGLTIGSATTGVGSIFFGDSGNNASGFFKYLHNGDTLTVGTGTSERSRIDSSGNFMVGKTAIAFATVGGELRANGQITGTRDGNASLILNRLNSDGEIAKFYKDGTAVGSIGNLSADFSVTNATATNGAGISLQNNLFVTPMKGGSKDSSSAVSLGNTSYTWKDLYLGGGLYVGGTGSANYLDDYEEGDWTPTLTGSGSAGSLAYNGQYGAYEKIGKLVVLTGFIQLTNKGSYTGNISIGNLPFLVAGGSKNYSGTVFYNSNLTLPANNYGAGAYPVPSNTSAIMFSQNSGGSSNLNWSAINNNSQIGAFTIVYFTDA